MGNKPLKNVLDETILFTNEKTEKSAVADLKPKAEPYLVQLSGKETGQNFALKGRVIRIGRDASCEICLDDPHVSRFHAEVILDGGAPVLRDMGSTNGIFINGNRIQEHRLNDGDKVLVGTRLYFRFTYQDAHDQSYQQNLFKAANMDALTQLYNKKYFLDALPKEMSFSRRTNENLSLMMLDIDHFKKINDTYGHLAGDRVLKAAGQQISKAVRLENISCRYGGEEFAVILRNCSPELAHTVAERLRMSIEQETIVFRDHKIRITVSIGIATYVNENFATIEDFIHAADELLYEAKRGGRNRTVTTFHRAKPVADNQE